MASKLRIVWTQEREAAFVEREQRLRATEKKVAEAAERQAALLLEAEATAAAAREHKLQDEHALQLRASEDARQDESRSAEKRLRQLQVRSQYVGKSQSCMVLK